MGTKERPGPYDCYDKALPDEPIFVLLGRDHRAPHAVLEWAHRYKSYHGPTAKYTEAVTLAGEMENWRLKNGLRITAAKAEEER